MGEASGAQNEIYQRTERSLIGQDLLFFCHSALDAADTEYIARKMPEQIERTN